MIAGNALISHQYLYSAIRDIESAAGSEH